MNLSYLRRQKRMFQGREFLSKDPREYRLSTIYIKVSIQEYSRLALECPPKVSCSEMGLFGRQLDHGVPYSPIDKYTDPLMSSQLNVLLGGGDWFWEVCHWRHASGVPRPLSSLCSSWLPRRKQLSFSVSFQLRYFCFGTNSHGLHC